MCGCHERSKQFSSEGLYHGRPIQPVSSKYVKFSSLQGMKKKTNSSFENFGKKK
ncbi:hypothetical protein J2Y67_002292 [Neobacillus niacini]|nr:hypothetical protein [Neobacillus niacini]